MCGTAAPDCEGSLGRGRPSLLWRRDRVHTIVSGAVPPRRPETVVQGGARSAPDAAPDPLGCRVAASPVIMDGPGDRFVRSPRGGAPRGQSLGRGWSEEAMVAVPMLADFAVRLAFGLIAALSLTSWRAVPLRFFAI